MTKHPSKNSVQFQSLIHDYQAINFQDALAWFIVGLHNSHLHGTQLQQAAANVQFHFNTVNVYHKIKFTSYDPYVVRGSRESVVDSIHSWPIWKDKRNWEVSIRFNTVVINDGTGLETGVADNLSFSMYLSSFHSLLMWFSGVQHQENVISLENGLEIAWNFFFQFSPISFSFYSFLLLKFQDTVLKKVKKRGKKGQNKAIKLFKTDDVLLMNIELAKFTWHFLCLKMSLLNYFH